MAEKIRLNDEQWKILLRLSSKNLAKLDEPVRSSRRLRSHGLVAQSQLGQEYLTEKGERRLDQGR